MNKQSLYWTIALHTTFVIILYQTKLQEQNKQPNKIIVTTIQKQKTPVQKTLVKKKYKIQTKIKKKPSAIIKKKSFRKKTRAFSRKTIAKKIQKQRQQSKSLSNKKIGNKTQNPSDHKPFIFSQTSINFLKNTLILPKKGRVKIRIAVQANGKIASIDVIEGQENKENAQYLVSKLKGINLIGFSSTKTETISIVFSNSKI